MKNYIDMDGENVQLEKELSLGSEINQIFLKAINDENRRAIQEMCEHDWDIEDFSGSGEGSYAFEYCRKCGIKSGK